MWDVAKAAPRGKCIAFNTYTKKKKGFKSMTQTNEKAKRIKAKVSR